MLVKVCTVGRSLSSNLTCIQIQLWYKKKVGSNGNHQKHKDGKNVIDKGGQVLDKVNNRNCQVWPCGSEVKK